MWICAGESTASPDLVQACVNAAADDDGMSWYYCARDADNGLDLSSIVSVLTRQMLHESVQTRITALHWLYHLYVNLPSKVCCSSGSSSNSNSSSCSSSSSSSSSSVTTTLALSSLC